MDTYGDLTHVPAAPGGRSLAVGAFDGVHLGHRRVIDAAVEWGASRDVQSSVVTFDPHPLKVLGAEGAPPLLTPPDIKAELVAELGVDELVVIPFTEGLARLDAGRFCRDVLAEGLGARHVSVGENFTFGHEAEGDAGFLERHRAFETSVVPLVERGGARVSSSRIRSLIADGDVSEASGLLGHPFQLEGVVVPGDGRGKSLGVPTANLDCETRSAVPGLGIYAALAVDPDAAECTPVPAAVSIGVRPTFESAVSAVVEAHLIDYEGNLYRRRLRLTFLERLRDELRFDSVDDLVRQMESDVEQVRKIVAGPV